jgi:hypothetical protein
VPTLSNRIAALRETNFMDVTPIYCASETFQGADE